MSETPLNLCTETEIHPNCLTETGEGLCFISPGNISVRLVLELLNLSKKNVSNLILFVCGCQDFRTYHPIS